MAKKPQRVAMGQIRIIAGQWRGRKLPVPDSEGLRPTTDRIRETLFNWLMPVINGARCLDCFAGSGALGFEALSRYASQVTFIEKARPIATQIAENIKLLQADNATIVNNSADVVLSNQPQSPYDVVFLDPPFRKDLLKETLNLLEKHNWLAENAYIYIETEAESGTQDIPPNWICHREKIAGQVSYRLYRRQSANSLE